MDLEITSQASLLQAELAEATSQLLSDAKPARDVVAEIAALCEKRAELLR